MIFVKSHNIQQFLQKYKIQCRPNAGSGLWLMFLVPLAIIISAAKHPVISTSTYKLSSIFSVGLICSSLVFLYQSSQVQRLKIWNFGQIVAWCIVAILFRICLHRGFVFSFLSAIVPTILYQKFYLFVLEKMPQCFTLGEAAVCCQSYILLLYCTTINIFQKIVKQPTVNAMQMSTLIIQIGLFGLSLIIMLAYKFGLKSTVKFYSVTALVFFLAVVLPIQVLSTHNPLLWILNLFWEDLKQDKVILYWGFFSVIAVIAINRRIKRAKKASTSVRKIFHVLSVVVFIQGLIYNCTLVYLASGVVLGLFFMFEILRILNMPPLGETLQNGLVVFGDEKDVGIIAFTPMYLLSGCSLPLWIHPAPCDVTNSAVFNLLPLLSGVLTTGIGDTAASIVGSKLGRLSWKGSNKTIEGTIACIASQLLVIFALVHLDFVKILTVVEYVKTVSAVVFISIVEAKTDQVDNLILPLIMYIILTV